MACVPRRGRAVTQHESFAFKQFAHGFEQSTRAHLVERQFLRVDQAHLFGPDPPMRRADKAPGAGAEVDAPALRQHRRQRQRAIGAGGEAEHTRDGPFMRRRQAQLVADIGLPGRQQGQQRLQLG
jgi:hypothetical protein